VIPFTIQIEADLSPYAGTTAYLTIGLVNSDSISYALRDLFFMQDGIGKTGLPSPGNRRAPSSITLNQNSPNPFSTSTEISFSLRETSDVTVVVSDVLGRVIRTIDLGTKSAGAHAFRFVPENLRTGVYLYRVASGGNSVARKMIVVR
jgi:hypothetical protein